MEHMHKQLQARATAAEPPNPITTSLHRASNIDRTSKKTFAVSSATSQLIASVLRETNFLHV
jgi:hypothetical protein